MDKILNEYDKILASEEFKIFIPFRNLLTKICLLSLLYKDVINLENKIAE